MSMPAVEIGGRFIGGGAPTYVIAEIGLSPGKDRHKALQLIDHVGTGGGDCAKFQLFTPEEIVSKYGVSARHFPGDDIVEAFRQMAVPKEFFPDLAARCREAGIAFLASVFDEPSLRFIDALAPPAYKIAAFELGDRFLLEAVAERGKPMIVSTGMASLADVERAVETVEKAGPAPIILLHAVSAYPAAPEDYNLRAMETMRSAFGCPVGISDHTSDLEVPIAAVALGAELIEKHVALSRGGSGPDDHFSLEPQMFRDMVAAIRRTEAMLGDGRKRMKKSEEDLHGRMRLALVARRDLSTGTVLGISELTIKRAGGGVAPDYADLVMGRALISALSADEPLQWSHLMGDAHGRS
jgi:sialic acid synthase SpsE